MEDRLFRHPSGTYQYSLGEEGVRTNAFTAWAVYDNNPHYKSVDIYSQNDAVSLDMSEARNLMNALAEFLRIYDTDDGGGSL